MKRVGITPRLVETREYHEVREALDERWGALLAHMGWIPVPLSYAIPFETYQSELGLSGVILSGGNDLSSLTPNPLSAKRDEYERTILQACKGGLPLLGICRGAQFIAHELGGALEPCKAHVGRHEILLEGARYEVNSYHNFAISALGAGLIPLARSQEGFIEAFGALDLPLVAMMWHAEREEVLSEPSARLLARFDSLMEGKR